MSGSDDVDVLDLQLGGIRGRGARMEIYRNRHGMTLKNVVRARASAGRLECVGDDRGVDTDGNVMCARGVQHEAGNFRMSLLHLRTDVFVFHQTNIVGRHFSRRLIFLLSFLRHG